MGLSSFVLVWLFGSIICGSKFYRLQLEFGLSRRFQIIPRVPCDSPNRDLITHVHGGQFSAGHVDGYIRLFDIRTPEMLVGAAQPHNQRVVGIGFQTGLEPSKIFSASQARDIQFLDIRNLQHTFLTIDAHQGSLSAFSVHRHASLIASGSTKEVMKVFNMEGHQLGNIKSYPTFIGRKIGSVSCLTFHPYQVRLAAGATDPFVSIYAE